MVAMKGIKETTVRIFLYSIHSGFAQTPTPDTMANGYGQLSFLRLSNYL